MEDRITGLKNDYDRQIAAQRLLLAALEGGVIKPTQFTFTEDGGIAFGKFLAAALNSTVANLKDGSSE